MACLKTNELERLLHEPALELRGHLAGCERCRVALDRAVSTHKRVGSLVASLIPAQEPSPDVPVAMARVRESARPRAGVPWFASPSRYLSIAIHAGFVALLMFGATNPDVQQSIRENFQLIDPTLTPFVPKPTQGGGGGGAREALPVSKGQLPKASNKPFVPPQIVTSQPKLAMEPSIVAPPDVPSTQAPNWGDPLAALLNNSNGPGSGGGMGSGTGGGLGSGHGPGYGPGSDGGYGSEVFRPGNGVSMPVVVLKVDPEYSEDARKAKYSGTVQLSVVVGKDGRAQDIRVLKSLGMGLDEKAMEAVSKWRFKPGMRDGRPVNVRAQIDVNFRLL